MNGDRASAGERDVVVVGAGAAGLMAAIAAAEGGARVVLLEGTEIGARKILISGGGRCNVLPSALTPEQYVTASSPHSLRKILLSWPLAEQRRYFEEVLGVRLALEVESGKLFPESNRAAEVREALFARAGALGVEVRFGWKVERVAPSDSSDERRGWSVRTGAGTVHAAGVVMATGGLSVPKTGSDGAGLRMLERLGHTVNPTYPALTPLTSEPPVHAELAGVSLAVSIDAPPPGGPFASRGGFLFTHRGYSGPSVLDVSHLAVRARDAASQPIRVRWCPMDPVEWERELTGGGSGTVGGAVRRHLPTRLADRLLDEAGIDHGRSLSQLRRDDRRLLIELLTAYPLPWTGDEGYRKAEVTGGGVALSEVHPVTLESRLLPGLFLCGELLDAFGPIGGYNFAWAWATGRAAGRGAAGTGTGEHGR